MRTHPYWPDGNGLYCRDCSLPRPHPVHEHRPAPPDPRFKDDD